MPSVSGFHISMLGRHHTGGQRAAVKIQTPGRFSAYEPPCLPVQQAGSLIPAACPKLSGYTTRGYRKLIVHLVMSKLEFETVIQELEELGTEQNRKMYRRHGVREDLFGVSFGNIRKLQKKIKTDHSLAQELWATGNHDARILATMIANSKIGADGLGHDWLESWAADLDNYIIADAFAELVSKTTSAREKAEHWNRSEDEWTRARWMDPHGENCHERPDHSR